MAMLAAMFVTVMVVSVHDPIAMESEFGDHVTTGPLLSSNAEGTTVIGTVPVLLTIYVSE